MLQVEGAGPEEVIVCSFRILDQGHREIRLLRLHVCRGEQVARVFRIGLQAQPVSQVRDGILRVAGIQKKASDGVIMDSSSWVISAINPP